MKERTLILIKPDGIEKGLIGEIFKRLENQNLIITEIKSARMDEYLCRRLYASTFLKIPQITKSLIDYLTGKKIIAAIIEGDDAIDKTSNIRGLSDPSKSPKGTIRGDFASDQDRERLRRDGKVVKNIMHSSSNKMEAEEEIKLFFKYGF